MLLSRNLICLVNVVVSRHVHVPDAKAFHVFNLAVYKSGIGVFSKWGSVIGCVLVFRTVILVLGFRSRTVS